MHLWWLYCIHISIRLEYLFFIGDKCQFAHGRRELRDVIRNSKYKTKLCQKYWLVGYCAYGPRCNFLHYELEADEEFVEHQEVLTNIDDDNDPINESIRIVELWFLHFLMTKVRFTCWLIHVILNPLIRVMYWKKITLKSEYI